MPGLKKNLFYSILLVLANYVFPFLTYPYVSRILGVAGIGACNFVDSVINYFILFSTLGINSLGVREIARNKGDRESLDRTFSNIFLVNLILTGIMLLMLVVLTFAVPQFAAHKDLMFIGAFKLLFNCLLVEWFYKGLEDFKLITLRSIVVKTLYVASVFLFVRQREDIWIYYLLSCLMVVVNALVNICFARGRVRISLSGFDFAGTFKSLLAIGVYSILTSMYTTFNVLFLGFISGDTEVGLYSNATKIYYMVMAVFTAFTSVMIPRMSELVSEGAMDKFKDYFHTAVDILFSFSFPLIIWMMALAPEIIRIIAGSEFGGSVPPMIIIAPLVFIIGYEQILVLQTLLPLGKDRILLRNSLIGAVTGLILNIVFVPLLASVGSAIVWIVTETLILVLSQIAVTREVDIRFPLRTTLKNFAVYLPLAALVAACCLIPAHGTARLAASVIVVGIYVAVYQLLIRKGELLVRLR